MLYVYGDGQCLSAANDNEEDGDDEDDDDNVDDDVDEV